ncbi:leukocyte immunoglobulin-like receptor subfamily A member 6 isoform X2 [Arvicanthis niloticus]|uniref:leukocyte immunoglobulin-like receptor subfamily A member 6 isoform X2 n=1 Tax=Arvicanthis niloticus TaxID=61156 RepID=UPI00402B6043
MGLILGSGNPVLSGAFSKPTIKVVPSNVVTIGQQVTIFCEGSLHAKEYCLHKEGSPDCLILRTLRETEKKAKFSISRIRWNHAGQYWCSYKTPTNMLRQSDIMELVVTGVILGEVMLSVLPSYVVTSGGNVTLQCASQVTYDRFILMKEDEKFSTLVPSWQTYPAIWRALFTVGPVTSNQRWRFTCYGYYLSNSQSWSRPSNHLELLVPGASWLFEFPQLRILCGCGERGRLLHCWWECKLVQPLCKSVWWFFRKLDIVFRFYKLKFESSQRQQVPVIPHIICVICLKRMSLEPT